MELIQAASSSFLLPKSTDDLHREKYHHRDEDVHVHQKTASDRMKVISSWESIKRIRKQC